MAYENLNLQGLNRRENGISKRIREEKLVAGERFEFRRGMYGNVYEVIDHERKVFYRQDRELREQTDLFSSPLPRYCDYCKKVCESIKPVVYQLTFEMIVRPKTNPTKKRETVQVAYASCGSCGDKLEKVPKAFLAVAVKEIHRDGKLIWKEREE